MTAMNMPLNCSTCHYWEQITKSPNWDRQIGKCVCKRSSHFNYATGAKDICISYTTDKRTNPHE